MDSFIAIAERLGFPAAILMVLLGIAGWCAKQLLGEPNGILRKMANKHIQFVDSTIVAMEVVAAKTEESSETVALVRDAAARAELSTAALHKAGKHACDVLDAACEKLEIADQTETSRRRIREELQNADQSHVGRDRIVGIGHV